MPNFLESLAGGLRSAATVLSPRIQEQVFASQERGKQLQAQKDLEMRRILYQHMLQQATPQAQAQALALKRQELKDQYLQSPEAQMFLEKQDDIGLIRDMARRGLVPPDEALKAIKEAREAGKPLGLGGGVVGMPNKEGGYDIQRPPTTGMTGLPDVAKYRALLAEAIKTGDTEGQQIYENLIKNRQDPTANERYMGTLQELSKKHESGEALSQDDIRRGEAAIATLTVPRVFTDPVTQQVYQIPPMQIPSSLTSWRQSNTPSSTPTPKPIPLPTTGGRKPLDAGTEKDMNLIGDNRSLAYGLRSGYDPSYGGWKSTTLGDAVVEFKRRFGDDTGMADWWQSYRQWVIEIRHAKFGATLTGNELAAFNQIVANPSQDPKVIEANLNKQIEILEKAAARRATALAKEGYNTEAIDARITPQPIATGKNKGKASAPVPTNAVVTDVPAGIDPKDWQFMTPEEKALWQKKK